jgi:pyruvate dehydrogenase E2 component (dihydrolipoamide acetyltransferase)
MANIVEMPKLGFDMAEGTLAKWVKSENDTVEKGEILAEIETDKATVEVESSFTGIVFKHLVKEGTAVPIGTAIAVVADEGEEVDLDALIEKSGAESEKEEADQPEQEEEQEAQTKTGSPASASTDTTKQSIDDDAMIKASPIAKRMAEEKGLDLSAISGSGPGGRIVKRDVEKASEKTRSAASVSTRKAQITPGVDEQIKISNLRKAIGARMTESRQTIPHFYITSMYDVAELLKTRKQLNNGLPDDQRVSVNDFIIRAVALALRDFPNLNASISDDTLNRHGDINIGNAVAVENGLLTVVVRNADQKPITQISQEANAMISRVKAGKVKNEDIEGSTFTISNLGMFNVEDFVAIINPPEAAILAIGSAKEIPVVVDGELGIGWRMKATISADHRITDGAEAAEFMQHLAQFLEQPWRLFA